MFESRETSDASSRTKVAENSYATCSSETVYPTRWNLWLSTLSDPRATVRHLIDNDKSRHVLLLASLWGAANQLLFATLDSFKESTTRGDLLLAAAGLGVAWGIAYLYVMGWLYGVAGRMLGGVGRAADCRTAIAWSFVPTLLFLPAYVAFMWAPRQAHFALGLVAVCGLWQVLLLWQTIGESHRFSTLKGFGTTLLAVFFVLGLWFAGGIIFSLATGR
jgi:hypothetical protein